MWCSAFGWLPTSRFVWTGSLLQTTSCLDFSLEGGCPLKWPTSTRTFLRANVRVTLHLARPHNPELVALPACQAFSRGWSVEAGNLWQLQIWSRWFFSLLSPSAKNPKREMLNVDNVVRKTAWAASIHPRWIRAPLSLSDWSWTNVSR